MTRCFVAGEVRSDVTKVLLSVHVLAAIILIGPVTVAASLFPRAARAALADRASDRGVLHWLHRVTRTYAVVGLAVPVFGVATGVRMHMFGQVWLTVAVTLTAAAVALLFAGVIPAQRRLVALAAAAGPVPDARLVSRLTSRAAGAAGVFALLWAVVTVLMIVRPGSTTGA